MYDLFPTAVFSPPDPTGTLPTDPRQFDVYGIAAAVIASKRIQVDEHGLPAQGAAMLTDLPDFLEARGGQIYIQGHRISLFAVMRQERRKANVVAAFPTVTPEVLAKVSYYCAGHQAEVEAYYEQQLEIMTENRRRYGELPSLDVLRARLASQS